MSCKGFHYEHEAINIPISAAGTRAIHLSIVDIWLLLKPLLTHIPAAVVLLKGQPTKKCELINIAISGISAILSIVATLAIGANMPLMLKSVL